VKLDDMIRRALDNLSVPYTIHKTKNHYFAIINGSRVLISGNHDKTNARTVRNTVRNLKRAAEKRDGRSNDRL